MHLSATTRVRDEGDLRNIHETVGFSELYSAELFFQDLTRPKHVGAHDYLTTSFGLGHDWQIRWA